MLGRRAGHAQRELPVGTDRLVLSVPGQIGGAPRPIVTEEARPNRSCRSIDVVGEFVQDAGGRERLQQEIAGVELGADAQAQPAEQAFDVADLQGAGGPNSGLLPRSRLPEMLNGSISTFDHTKPADGSMNQPLPKPWL